MTAPLLLDPFEHEMTLADDPRTLSFAPRAFEVPPLELLRHLAFDLVGQIPRPLGDVSESLAAISGGEGAFKFESSCFQVGASVLAIQTSIEELGARHRVLEFLGVGEDLRVRINYAELNRDLGKLPAAARAELDEGRSLGQVRIWGNEASLIANTRRTLGRAFNTLGLESRILDRSVPEPTYRPPAAGRFTIENFPHDDLRVMEILLALLRQMPVEGASKRAPRRIGAHRDRVRRKGSIVSYAYETHRAGTGVLHMRRREVEAGVERPGLVRTFVAAGLAGGARLRIRDVGGRAVAEFAGSSESVEAIRNGLTSVMGAAD